VCKIESMVKESTEIQRLMQALMLDGDQIRQLLDLFHLKMDKMLPQLQEAIAQCSYDRIAHIAHTIKGSSGNFRYEELSQLAALIEEAARQERVEFDFSDALTKFQQLYKEIYSSR
jgi:HPt (histidine-containing phosphotransfer) domain-containing protein